MNNINTENNYVLDYKNYHLTQLMKFLTNFILTYLFLEILFLNKDYFSNIQLILIICTFSSILLYILDANFPSCSIIINNK
jgi:hypothetical protein